MYSYLSQYTNYIRAHIKYEHKINNISFGEQFHFIICSKLCVQCGREKIHGLNRNEINKVLHEKPTFYKSSNEF